MALHNFNYTYAFVSRTVTLTETGVPVVDSVVVDITAIDQADNTKTITTREERALNHHSLLKGALPDSFVACRDVTEQQQINWFKAGTATADLDGFYTWQLYGYAEMDGT